MTHPEEEPVYPAIHNHYAASVIEPATLHINIEYDGPTVSSIDLDVNDRPDGNTSTLNPAYIGDVVAAVLRANTPIARLRADMGPGGANGAGARIGRATEACVSGAAGGAR